MDCTERCVTAALAKTEAPHDVKACDEESQGPETLVFYKLEQQNYSEL